MKWIEVKVVTTPEASEAVAGMMYDMDIGGLYIEDPGDVLQNPKNPTDWDYVEDELRNVDPNQVIIRAYLPESINYQEKIVLLKEKLKNAAKYFNIGDGEIRLSEVYEKDWANNWKKYYKPVKVGQKIVIKPSWEKYKAESGSDIVIEIDPGMAFGTGTHETTKMCIQLLEKYVKMEGSALDIGCGSGILGIAAIKLGINNCISVDIDPNAVRVTSENAEINNVIDKMDIREGNLLDVVTGQYEVIVANIIADAIIELSSVVGNYLKEQGVFIASGIIKDRYDEVKTQLLHNGFTVKDELFMGEWVAVAVSE